MKRKNSIIQKLWNALLLVGPGFFCIGYTIGTGSVTSMAKAGSQYGLQLLWVLALSCLFSWVLMEAYGRFAVVSGGTAIYSFKKQFKFGKFLSIAAIIGVVTGQWFALSGLIGLISNALYEAAHLFIPGLDLPPYWTVLGIAVVILLIMYAMLMVGRYSYFETVLVFFVTAMGLAFILSMFIVLPSPREVVSGLLPGIPKVEGAMLMTAAFVGTTMAAPTFVVRPLLMKGKGWNRENTGDQSRDAFVSALLMFLISGSIMVCATGALFRRGLEINNVLDMVRTLEPIAGRFAVALFLVGTVSAGLSSVLPILMVCPLLLEDFQAGELDTRSHRFKILTAVACVIGLSVPLLGAQPIAAQIATQVAQVFVLPLVTGGIFVLVNRKNLMGQHRAGTVLNAGIVLAFLFSLIMSFIALKALAHTLRF